MASGTRPGINKARAAAALLAGAFLGLVVGITGTYALLGVTDQLAEPIQQFFAILVVAVVLIVVAASFFGFALCRWIREPTGAGRVAAQSDTTLQDLSGNRADPMRWQSVARPPGRNPLGHTTSQPVSASTHENRDLRPSVYSGEGEEVRGCPVVSPDPVGEQSCLGHPASSSTMGATSSEVQAHAKPPPEREIQPSAGIAGAGAAAAVPTIDPDALVAAWDAYRSGGDGHFNSEGLQGVLDDHGIEAVVMKGESIGAGDQVLMVLECDPGSRVFLVPNFTKSPKSVADWFDDQSDGALTGRVRKLVKLAEGNRTLPGKTDFDLVVRGCVA